MQLKNKILNKSNSYKYYQEEYTELNKKIRDKNNTISILKNDLRKYEITIANLKDKINEKNSQILDLNRNIEKNQAPLTELNNKLKQEQTHISNLNNKVKENITHITNLNSEVIEKDKQISLLNERLERIYDESTIKKNIFDVNIAYVLRAFPIHSETFVVNEVRWLKENGYNISIFCNKESPKFIDIDFDVEINMFKNLLELEQLLIKKEIDYVHTHFVYPTCTHFTYPVCEKLKIPFSVFAHAYDIFNNKNVKRNQVDEISNSKYCKAIYTLSNFHKNYLISKNVNEKKIVITKQATDYNISGIIPKKNNIKNIISISRFVEKKGIDVLIDAAKILEDEDFEFSIYGYGDLKDKLQTQINELNCSNIQIKGELHPNEVQKILKESDLLVSPCKIAKNGDMDGFPTVIFEAMAAGLPILTTNISAIPEIIKDSENGFLIPPNDPQCLANKIIEISKISDKKMNNIRKQAQKDVENISSTNKTMYKFLDLIRKNFKNN